MVGIEGVCITTDFEVIKIVDYSNPYLALLGLDWEFANMDITNLKKRQMLFESNNVRNIVPLDALEGARYTKPIKEEYSTNGIDNIY